tara:strand:+ start:1152 stop:2042 length:891 start_codon:yes stop_codon:yes gene_type:complete
MIMDNSDILLESNLADLVHRGKVRDTHTIGEETLLMVSTDRISAYDVVMPNAIPDKGAILNQMSVFWFALTRNIVPNHLISFAMDTDTIDIPENVKRRSMIVRKADRIDIECVARGYITGSALQEYKDTGTIAGIDMPQGLREGDRFKDPIFTPATKAETGHDENISIDEMKDIVGEELTNTLERITLEVYDFAHQYALEKNIIIADTKMEFGFIEGQLCLIDELLTPDSSRFWDRGLYSPGKTQPNYDKQYVRDWLGAQGWDREPPAPELPQKIVAKTSIRYREAFDKLTGTKLR